MTICQLVIFCAVAFGLIAEGCHVPPLLRAGAVRR